MSGFYPVIQTATRSRDADVSLLLGGFMFISTALLFLAVSKQHQLPDNLLSSLCYVESRHSASAIHKDDGGSSSLGICQIKYKTAQWLGYKGTPKGLMQPGINTFWAAEYLQYQLLRYNNNVFKAIIAYNRGNAKNLTRTKYLDKVLKQWKGK